MYSTCLFCHASLGANESIERFPVGKRLAFDAAKGRLWVVCEKCERWNLTPIEERWEAIEECERAYRDTKKRVATDNIGLARLRDRTTLIRIGSPLRPEFAAWRYGDQFGRRRKKNLLITGAAVTAIAVAPPLISTFGNLGLWGAPAVVLPQVLYWQWLGRPAAIVVDHSGYRHRLSRSHLQFATLRTHWAESEVQLKFVRPDDVESIEARSRGILRKAAARFRSRMPSGHAPELTGSNDIVTLSGAVAMRALGTMLPAVNEMGARARRVQDAVQMIESQPSAAKLTNDIRTHQRSRFQLNYLLDDQRTVRLGYTPAVFRLALEMTLHEEDERRALEGELRELEQRWKDAEEIAAISDNLLSRGPGTDGDSALPQSHPGG